MESSDHTFPRAERLRSRKQIARLFEKGESGVVYPIRYVFLTGEDDAGDATDEGGLSVLVSVSKRNHKRANVRNLLKRRIREAYRGIPCGRSREADGSTWACCMFPKR